MTDDLNRVNEIASAHAAELVCERLRVLGREGMTEAGDDVYASGELAKAAAAYLLANVGHSAGRLWPWSSAWFKPKDHRRNLIRAGQLLLAELARHDRALAKKARMEAETRRADGLLEGVPVSFTVLQANPIDGQPLIVQASDRPKPETFAVLMGRVFAAVRAAGLGRTPAEPPADPAATVTNTPRPDEDPAARIRGHEITGRWDDERPMHWPPSLWFYGGRAGQGKSFLQGGSHVFDAWRYAGGKPDTRPPPPTPFDLAHELLGQDEEERPVPPAPEPPPVPQDPPAIRIGRSDLESGVVTRIDIGGATYTASQVRQALGFPD